MWRKVLALSVCAKGIAHQCRLQKFPKVAKLVDVVPESFASKVDAECWSHLSCRERRRRSRSYCRQQKKMFRSSASCTSYVESSGAGRARVAVDQVRSVEGEARCLQCYLVRCRAYGLQRHAGEQIRWGNHWAQHLKFTRNVNDKNVNCEKQFKMKISICDTYILAHN
jgi:hypothetical protein